MAFKKCKSDHNLLLAYLEMTDVRSVDYICQTCKLYILFWTYSKLWAIVIFECFSKRWKFPNFRLCWVFFYYSFMTIVLKTNFWMFLETVETLVLWQKIVQNLLISIFVYLSCPKKSRARCRKTIITREKLVADNFSTLRCIAFLIFYWLVYKMSSRFSL